MPDPPQASQIIALSLTGRRPDWPRALSAAQARRPPGGVERRARAGRGDAGRSAAGMPRRRVTDDLALLRAALEDPRSFGLEPAAGRHSGTMWRLADGDGGAGEIVDACERLQRRGILEASGLESVRG